MLRAICPLCVLISCVALISLAGCSKSGPSVDPAKVKEFRTQWTLAEEPDGGQLVSDVRLALLGEDEAAESDEEHASHEGETESEHAAHAHEEVEEAEEHELENAETAEEQAEEELGESEEEADLEDEASEESLGESEEPAGEGTDAEENVTTQEAEHEEEHASHEGETESEHAAHAHEEGGEGHDEHAGHDHEGHAEHASSEVAITEATEAQEMVIVGQIGGLANPWKETQPDFPFANNQAVFFLADPIAVVENEEAGHNHAPGEECAFCEAHAADKSDMLAKVQFVDEKGNVLPMDIRDLFDVKVSDTVVVHGSAQIVPGGMMVVTAKGLYIRR